MFTLWRSETEERTTDSILPGWWHCIRVLRLDESRVEVIETRINFDLWQVEKYYRGKKSRLFAPHSCWVDRKSCRQDGSITTLTGQNQHLNPPPADVFSDRLKGNEEAIQSDQDMTRKTLTQDSKSSTITDNDGIWTSTFLFCTSSRADVNKLFIQLSVMSDTQAELAGRLCFSSVIWLKPAGAASGAGVDTRLYRGQRRRGAATSRAEPITSH